MIVDSVHVGSPLNILSLHQMNRLLFIKSGFLTSGITSW